MYGLMNRRSTLIAYRRWVGLGSAGVTNEGRLTRGSREAHARRRAWHQAGPCLTRRESTAAGGTTLLRLCP